MNILTKTTASQFATCAFMLATFAACSGGTSIGPQAATEGVPLSAAQAQKDVDSVINSASTQRVLAAAVSDSNCAGLAQSFGQSLMPFLPGVIDANILSNPNGMFSQNGFFGSHSVFDSNAINANIFLGIDPNIFAGGVNPNSFTGWDPNGLLSILGGLNANSFSVSAFNPNSIAGFDPSSISGFNPNVLATVPSFDPNSIPSFTFNSNTLASLGGFNPNTLVPSSGAIDPNALMGIINGLQNNRGSLASCLGIDPNTLAAFPGLDPNTLSVNTP